MDNLLYLSHDGECPYCGGRGYVRAIYMEVSATGWHIMVEEACQDCDRLDVTDLPQRTIEKMVEDMAASEQ